MFRPHVHRLFSVSVQNVCGRIYACVEHVMVRIVTILDRVLSQLRQQSVHCRTSFVMLLS